MKKLLAIGLVCLILTACGTTGDSNADASGQQRQEQLYNPNSKIELQTGGAVRAYSLPEQGVSWMIPMGNKILLANSSGRVSVISGENAQVMAQKKIATQLLLTAGSYDAAQTGFAYYAQSSRQVVLLNPQLQKNAVYDLPEDAQTYPSVSLHKQEIYYYTGTQLRALSMQTGISRLIRTFSDTQIVLGGVYFDGAVISCLATDAVGYTQTLYICTQTGQTLKQDDHLLALSTQNTAYFALRQDGKILQKIFSEKDEQPKSLNIEQSNVVAALAMNGAVAYTVYEDALQMHLYDFASGKQIAQVWIPDITDPVAVLADDGGVWLIAYENGVQGLYRWDVTKSQTEDQTVYTGWLYTYENPDSEGLSQLQSRVDTINSQYGVKIQIFRDALLQTGGFTMQSEHQTLPIRAFLNEIELLLQPYPKGFLRNTVQAGWIRICFVRQIEGDQDFVQYWADGDCYIAISINADVETAFLRALGCAIDAHVLGNSRDFDTWDTLNPEGFVYGYPNSQYLTGENRAFADEDSMRGVLQERSRLFAYASTDGNDELFASAIMQAKLKRLCMGIREAYGLEKSSQTYIWEQYLTDSLAYKK